MAKYKVLRPHRVNDQVVREGEIELKPEHAAPHIKAGHLAPIEPVESDEGDGKRKERR